MAVYNISASGFFTWVTVVNESSDGKYGGEGMIVYCYSFFSSSF
jgi:hypothetical protein